MLNPFILVGVGNSSTQTESSFFHTRCASTQADSALISARHFQFDDPGMHYYTGLHSFKYFEFLLHALGPAAYHLKYFHGVVPSLSVEDQLFCTLMKLRQHKPNFEMSRMFGVQEATITNIFVTWINFMALELGDIDWWPSSELVRFNSPRDFKLKYPSTRLIVDGTECPVQKPKEPLAQQATFSSYKNRNTLKVLVGASPGGLVSYVSPAYCGSTSDRQICERSNLVTMCEPGDSIMADKGFNVQDLFEARRVTINIPTFFSKKNRLSGNTVMNDRKIASKRVHIERIIGLAKTFKILCQPLNNTESALASEVIGVCFLLCNFRPNIIPKYA